LLGPTDEIISKAYKFHNIVVASYFSSILNSMKSSILSILFGKIGLNDNFADKQQYLIHLYLVKKEKNSKLIQNETNMKTS